MLNFEAHNSPRIESILTADVGSLWTRVALFDVVAGEYRFLARASAPTTAELPFGDITVGLYNAMSELEKLTGRQLVDEGHILLPMTTSGNGVDAFIAASSAAPSMRVVLLAITRDITARSAIHAAESTYSNVLELITVDETTAKGDQPEAEGDWFVRQVRRMIALQPEAAIIVGGVDGGPVAPLIKLANVVAAAAQDRNNRAQLVNARQDQLPVVYAGNQSARGKVLETLETITDLRLIDNIRPRLDRERLGPAQEQLDSLYIKSQLDHVAGYQRLSSWTETIMPTALATGIVTRYVAGQYKRDVLTVDIGASSVSAFLTNSATSDVEDRPAGQTQSSFYRVVRGDFGLSYGLPNLLREVGVAAINRWLPFEIGEEELSEWALNRMLRPLTISQTRRELQLEHAFAREGMRYLARRLREQAPDGRPSYDLLIGTGGVLAHAPSLAAAALLMLDGLEPEGLPAGSVELAVDGTMILPHIGVMAAVSPAAAAYIFDRDSLLWLGTAVVPLPAVAHPSPGQPAVTVTVTYADGSEPLKAEVAYGEIRLIPLRLDQRASLAVQPGKDFRIGSGERGKLVRTMGDDVKGGYVGLIVDARGRPLHLPGDVQGRQATMRRWQQALGIVAPEPTTRQPTGTLRPPGAPDQTLPPLATRLNLNPEDEQAAEETSFDFGTGSSGNGAGDVIANRLSQMSHPPTNPDEGRKKRR